MTSAILRRPVMAPLRDWLKTQSTPAGSRIYVDGLPKAPTYPAAVLSRAGDGSPSEWLDAPLVQVDCWADTGAAAEGLATAVLQVLERAKVGVTLGTTADGVQLMGAAPLSLVSLPDPDLNKPRYVLTVDLSVKAVEVP